MGKSLKSFFVVIFILLLEFCSLSLLFLIPFQHAFHKDNIKEVVLKSTSDHLEENNLLSDIIHERLNSATSGGKQEEIKEDVMQKLMESDEMRELAASIVGNISDYIITGKEQSVITEEELKKIVADAIDTINKGGDYTISEEEKDKIIKHLDENASAYLDDIAKINTLDQSLTADEKVTLNFFRFFFSTTLVIIVFTIMIISFLGILAFKWKDMKWLKINSITILVASVISILITLLLYAMNQLIFKQEISYIFSFFDKMVKESFLLSGSICVGMILLLVIYHIFMSKQEKLLTVSS